MSKSKINEDLLEQAALQWFAEQGYTVIHGPDIAPDAAVTERPALSVVEASRSERESFEEIVLSGRIRSALERINPNLSADAIDEAHKQLLRMDAPTSLINNQAFHRFVTDGVSVS